MSYIERDRIHYNKIRQFTENRDLLVLGNQVTDIESGPELFACKKYATLDLDNGTYPLDLTGDLSHMDKSWDVVFDLGTIEHVWDIHKAYCNVARLVKVGGLMIGHVVGGIDHINHGIHVTNPQAVLMFFKQNGFVLCDHWYSENFILWYIAVKTDHRTEFKVPLQVWDNLEKVDIR